MLADYVMSVVLYYFFFFFSSRRRHTRCALVTGVQTCALPILFNTKPRAARKESAMNQQTAPDASVMQQRKAYYQRIGQHKLAPLWERSEERRVGKECVS